MSPGTLPLGGRRGRPAEPRRQDAEEEGEEAVGEVLRQAHEARAPGYREDARQGEGLPRDGRRAGARAVDGGQRGRAAPVRHGAEGARGRARAGGPLRGV